MRMKQPISGKVIAAREVEVKTGGRSKLIPGQKVIIYNKTDRKIMGASGKILGSKETVLGSGRVQVDGGRTIIKSQHDLGVGWSVKGAGDSRLSATNKQASSSKTDVYIKPIDE